MRILWISVNGHDERELGDLDGACKSVGAGGMLCQLLDGRLARVELNLPWNEMRATYGGRARTLSPTLTSQMFSPVTPNELTQQPSERLAFRPPFKSMRRSRGEKSSDTAREKHSALQCGRRAR